MYQVRLDSSLCFDFRPPACPLSSPPASSPCTSPRQVDWLQTLTPTNLEVGQAEDYDGAIFEITDKDLTSKSTRASFPVALSQAEKRRNDNILDMRAGLLELMESTGDTIERRIFTSEMFKRKLQKVSRPRQLPATTSSASSGPGPSGSALSSAPSPEQSDRQVGVPLTLSFSSPPHSPGPSVTLTPYASPTPSQVNAPLTLSRPGVSISENMENLETFLNDASTQTSPTAPAQLLTGTEKRGKFSCVICDYDGKDNYALQRHVQQSHTIGGKTKSKG